jgi:hypothetical protein
MESGVQGLVILAESLNDVGSFLWHDPDGGNKDDESKNHNPDKHDC